MNYAESGVDIERAQDFIESIQTLTSQTPKNPNTISNNSGYGACFSIPSRYTNPIIVTTTDGVGTKVKLAALAEWDHLALFNIGIDVVAMCVNDLICEGAEPIHFLDYYATSDLNLDQGSALISGIIAGCELAGCELVGGETAEMPGTYATDEFDIAGFAIGIAEKEQIPHKDKVKSGDVIIGIKSNGVHSNGYSLVRRILEESDISLQDEFEAGITFEQELLKPTAIYVKEILTVLHKYSSLVKGIAHITGGGFYGNIPRILPNNIQAHLMQDSWQWPSIFSWIKREGDVSLRNMYETFNCGIGMILIVDAERSNRILNKLTNSMVIGYVETKSINDDRTLVIHNGNTKHNSID